MIGGNQKPEIISFLPTPIMKRKLFICVVAFIGLTIGIYSSCTDNPFDEFVHEEEIYAARSYFENLFSVDDIGEEFEQGNGVGFDPGDFTPNWETATVSKDFDSVVNVEVDIYSTLYYGAKWSVSSDDFSIAKQKLLILTDKSGNRGAGINDMCGYIMTIFTDERNNVYGHEFSNVKPSSKFCGIVAYSLIGNNKVVRIDRYENGVKTRGVSIFDGREKSVVAADMEYVFSNITIGRGTRSAYTRGSGFEEDDPIQIEDVVCTGGGSSGSDYGGFFNWWYIGGGGYYNGGGYDPIDKGGLGGGGGGYRPPQSNSPLSKKLFRNSSISEANWEKIEKMIEKIMADCMGGKLYNALDDAMGSGTLAINLVNASGVGGLFDLSAGIFITGFDSQDLFHEMLHAFQAYQETETSFNNASANREVEAYLAEYMYAGKLTGGNRFDPDVRMLFDEYLTENGTLKDPSMEAMFNSMFKDVANHIRIIYEQKYNNPTPYDDKRTGMRSIANIRHLAQNC
jgi:hypothetical protein